MYGSLILSILALIVIGVMGYEPNFDCVLVVVILCLQVVDCMEGVVDYQTGLLLDTLPTGHIKSKPHK